MPEGVGKRSLLFIEIAPQGADPGDLFVSGIRYGRFTDVVRGVPAGGGGGGGGEW